MQAFEYARPNDQQEALRLLSDNWNDAAILAGGTDLISLMKEYIETPKRVVSITGLNELRNVRATPQGLSIGALVSLTDLMNNAEVRRSFPALAHAANLPSQQIRNMGTVGGELLQRPRCWYFRNGYGLLGELNGKSLVRDGDNRYHAILGNSGPALFVNPSSLAPLLIAYGASVRLAGRSSTRTLPLAHFFTTPRNADERENLLRPNEILTEIVVPTVHGAHAALYEVRQKTALDWPLTAAAAVLQMNGNVVRSARIVMGHVAPVPWHSPEAEQAIIGKPINEQTAAQAGAAAVAKATPLSRNGYKVQLARVAVKRALLRAAGQQAGEGV